MRKRVLFLPAAAILIAGLCAYRLSRPDQDTSALVPPSRAVERAAPIFQGLDPDNRLVRLDSYYGRHRILVVFFDGEAGADRDPILEKLRRDYDRLAAAGMIVVGISAALPQENRRVFERSGKFPFALLTDLEYRVHRDWGRYDETTGRPLTGVFLLDRKGAVAWAGDHPRPLDDPLTAIDRLLKGL